MLLLIDAQRNMLEPPAPVLSAGPVGAAIATLLERARAAGAPVIHVRNNGGPDDPDVPCTPGWELVHAPLAGEPVVDKTVPDSFAGTGLDELVPAGSTIVVAGMQSEWCVRQTSLAALARGHRVLLVAGAHSTYDEGVSDAVERELAEAGAELVTLDRVAF